MTSADDATDPNEFLRRDPALAGLVDEHGPIEVEPHPDPFGRLVRSIVNQQLSGASAAAIRERLADRFEITPDAPLVADEAALRETGLSLSKVDYLRSAAAAFQAGRLDPARFDAMSDAEAIDELVEIRGVGVWTAKMFLVSDAVRRISQSATRQRYRLA